MEANRKPRKSRKHRRGEGSVYRDKAAGVWVASVSVGWREGKRVRRRVTAPTRDLAVLELTRLRQAYGRAKERALMSVGEYMAEWLVHVRPTVTASTWATYENDVRLHITPGIGRINVAQLKPNDVRRLIAERLDAGLSPSTIGGMIVTLRMALGVLVKEGELPMNVALVDPPRVDREPVEALTPQRAALILDAVKGDRLEALYVLLLGTGLRLGEAIGLDWRDLDNGHVFVRRGKTRAATRTIPLPDFVKAALEKHRKAAKRYGPNEPVFLGEKMGHRLRGDYVSHAFPRLLQEKGLPKMRVHDLRHGTATLLLQKGVPMREIAEILGHANPAITAQVYAHVTSDQKRSAMEKLGEALG
jgi:integrase